VSDLRIAIILGSTRPGRKGKDVADWVAARAGARTTAHYDLVDLVDNPLPHIDEPMPPTLGQYAGEHTKAWAEKIGSYDGFVFVTPEYNHSTSGVLKKRNRLPLRRVEQQGRRVRQLRVAGWGPGDRAPAGDLQ
jgi:NAD(P)H-dependent FMN reductase